MKGPFFISVVPVVVWRALCVDFFLRLKSEVGRYVPIYHPSRRPQNHRNSFPSEELLVHPGGIESGCLPSVYGELVAGGHFVGRYLVDILIEFKASFLKRKANRHLTGVFVDSSYSIIAASGLIQTQLSRQNGRNQTGIIKHVGSELINASLPKVVGSGPWCDVFCLQTSTIASVWLVSVEESDRRCTPIVGVSFTY